MQWVDRSTGTFFGDYPHVDILVHQEGEQTLAAILEAYTRDRDYSGIDGLETRDYATAPRERMNNLDEVPSPYLTGLVWDLVEPVEGALGLPQRQRNLLLGAALFHISSPWTRNITRNFLSSEVDQF